MRLLAVSLGVALVVGGLSGCSGGSDEGGKPQGGSGTQGQAPPTPAAALASVALPGQPGPLVDLISRQARSAGTVHAEIYTTGGEGAQKIDEKTTAQMRTGVRSPSAQLTIVDANPSDPSTTEAIVTGGTVYTRVDGQEQAPGKPWVRLSRKDAANPELKPFAKLLTGMLDGVDQAMAQLSTDTGLALVRNGSFEGAAGNEKLDGVAVHSYSGSTPASSMKESDPAFDALSQIGVGDIPWKLWVDGKGLPQKFQVEVATQGTKTVHVVTYKQWGEPLTVEAPPAAKVHILGA
ncbi:LppX_LprAFG lipoprotein [Actinomadura sp. 7K507]|uniref:LppX_LprAFG lipoprotein n=1 Tax=Actinomadura sp. 7K507 TaxID=2530365 RepID=UPI001042EF3F|nr:LppX_LprAFG lipoprotein [Actinomadura sp. 7K507]TDC75566.1 LppX_LprAFG lipoprotein [Actinomadura sp. 7K507]